MLKHEKTEFKLQSNLSLTISQLLSSSGFSRQCNRFI